MEIDDKFGVLMVLHFYPNSYDGSDLGRQCRLKE